MQAALHRSEIHAGDVCVWQLGQFDRFAGGLVVNLDLSARIFVDRANPNAAFISYSGFNAITPGTPGHIFRAVFDPQAGRAVFTILDGDLGDIPLNTIAFDHVRGDLYAATDFGPLLLRNGSATWEIAGLGFPEALMVDFEIIPERRLLIAATHGIGIFYLRLPE